MHDAVTYRESVIAAACAKMGDGPLPEWAGLQWCGLFALACLHEAGLGLDITWHTGGGFLRENPHAFIPTDDPRPGDIGVQHHAPWHHVIVTDRDGRTVGTVAGNTGARPGKVGAGWALVADYQWYSIEPLEAVP